jgi:pyruvate/2-oxoacid:ferredoxin oxidoreductase beta subunit
MIEKQSKYPRTEYMEAPRSACPGCALPLAFRYFLKVMGGKVVFILPPGCSPVVVNVPRRVIRYEGQLIRVLLALFGSGATMAAGFKTGLRERGDTETEVVAWTGDGATLDIGLGAVSAAAERNEDIIYVCCDNEAYMNTGNQRSSATPLGAITTTSPLSGPKSEWKKDIMSIMVSHSIPYAATLTVAYPDDFMRKVETAKQIRGFRFLYILTPCPTGWRYRAEETVKISRLAVETNVFPLFEVKKGIHFIINKEPDGIPLEKYTATQGRYAHLTSQQIKEIQERVEQRWKWLKWLASYKE